MSVARSAYRQLLRVGKSVSEKYADPNDMCFALFGLLVTRHDFANAGYGGSYPEILRTCFLRPSVRDDPHDTASARISAAFDALRRLNEITLSQTAFRVRELRQEMADVAEEKEKATASESMPLEGKKARRGEAGKASASTAASLPPSSTSSLHSASRDSGAAASSSSSSSDSSSSLPASAASSTAQEIEAVAAATSRSIRASSATKSGTTMHRLDEGVDLIRGSVLIERSSRRRIQNFPRHCVVCEPISMVFPPYRFCVPPEPAYLLAVRNEFALHGITDVLLALSATSIFNAHRQSYLREIGHEAADEGVEDGPAAPSAEVADAEAASAPAPRGFPTTRAELQHILQNIPTRTVMQTDVLEVEITTEYVCSNPASASSETGTGQRKGAGMDGVFTTTTPLKGTPTSPSSSSRDSATSGPGAATAEDDDVKAHLFLYYVYVRNRGPKKNPQRWHAQVLSHHLVVVDVAQAQVLEMGRPGVMGNFPLLPPGASHCFESGTTLSGPEGLIRGSIQVNLFNDVGEMVMLDAAIAPTRLTVGVTSARGFTTVGNAKEELVQRTSDAASKKPAMVDTAQSTDNDDDDGSRNR